jgi:hypothetical protein
MARANQSEPNHQRASWRFLAASACLRSSSAASLVVRAISLRIALRSRAASAASRSALAFAGRETDLRSSSSNFVGFGGGSGKARPSPFQTSNAHTFRNDRGLDYLIREFRTRAYRGAHSLGDDSCRKQDIAVFIEHMTTKIGHRALLCAFGRFGVA